MRRAELPAQIGQGKECGLRHGVHGTPPRFQGPWRDISQMKKKPRLPRGYMPLRGMRLSVWIDSSVGKSSNGSFAVQLERNNSQPTAPLIKSICVDDFNRCLPEEKH